MQLTVAPQMQWWGTIEYIEALHRMSQAHTAQVSARKTVGQPFLSVTETVPNPESALPGSDGGPPAEDPGDQRISEFTADNFFYLEHPPVITYGRSTPPGDIHLQSSATATTTPATALAREIPTIEVPRGGLATYHAPGQLVGYIVMDLTRRANGARPDIHAYLRALELGLIAFLKAEFDLDAGLREGFTGVWASSDRKLTSIGVSARKWITSHGFALNICPDMAGFDAIIPCGITDAEMTSVKLELERAGRQFSVKPMRDWAEAAHVHIVHALQNEGWFL